VLTERWAPILTVKVIIKFCTFRKMDKMYTLILVTKDL